MKKLSILINGIIKENPVLVLVLGTCPTLAVTTQVSTGLGMGIAATFVLLGSNVFISLLKDVIPEKVRIPCFVVVIASLVTIVQMIVQAFSTELYKSLGIYLPLIVVNCIILARAEMFANKNSVLDSALDGIGMGLGFTLTLVVMGAIREFIGTGAILGYNITAGVISPMSILSLAPGGFFVFGILVAIANKISKGKILANKKEFGCTGCPMFATCGKPDKCEAEGGGN